MGSGGSRGSLQGRGTALPISEAGSDPEDSDGRDLGAIKGANDPSFPLFLIKGS